MLLPSIQFNVCVLAATTILAVGHIRASFHSTEASLGAPRLQDDGGLSVDESGRPRLRDVSSTKRKTPLAPRRTSRHVGTLPTIHSLECVSEAAGSGRLRTIQSAEQMDAPEVAPCADGQEQTR